MALFDRKAQIEADIRLLNEATQRANDVMKALAEAAASAELAANKAYNAQKELEKAMKRSEIERRAALRNGKRP